MSTSRKRSSRSSRRTRRHGDSTPEQWALGGDILEQGEKHAAIKTLKGCYDDVVKALKTAAERSRGMKRIGVGRTEDPTLIPANVVPAIEELAENSALVAKQLRTLGG